MLTKVKSVLVMAAMAASANAATYTTGDLLLGFRALSGTGTAINYVVNIGQASAYRDGGVSGTIAIGDIATDLVATYGSNWYSRTDLQWAVIGSPSNTSTVSGDPSKTVYYTIPNGDSSSGLAMGSTLRGTASTNMVGLERGATGFSSTQYTDSVNSAYAKFVSTATPSDWASYMNGGDNVGGRTVDFDAISEVEGIPATTLGLYRSSTSSAGTYLGSFSLGSDGSLSFASVPEPSSVALTAIAALAAASRRRRNS
jgi:hypothetical protein